MQGSWAVEMADLKPGFTLISINSEPVTTFAAGKVTLAAAAKACSAEQPFIEMVWQRIAGAEEGVPPGPTPLSCAARDSLALKAVQCATVTLTGVARGPAAVKQWGLLDWNPRWLTFSDGVFSLYNSKIEPGPTDGRPPLLQVTHVEMTSSVALEGAWAADLTGVGAADTVPRR
jgi:hypothetical protein